MIDLTDPTLDRRLQLRRADGRFEISEIELVVSMRTLHGQGDMPAVQRLAEVLVQRCAPIFQRHSQGLRHRPDLREEAIANMGEHLLREALNPQEIFMTKNFIHYVRCLCIDEFNRMLRQEGMQYRRDATGRPAGKPTHIPRALMDSLRPASPDDEGAPTADVVDPLDQYEQVDAQEESKRILTYLSDPMDRMIMVLRAIEGRKWDDIAIACKKTERTVRLRYERARSHLRECIRREQQVTYTPVIQQQ